MTFCGDLPFVPSGIHHHLFENLRRKGHHCHGRKRLSGADRKSFCLLLGKKFCGMCISPLDWRRRLWLSLPPATGTHTGVWHRTQQRAGTRRNDGERVRETALPLTSRRPFAGMPGAQATARQGWRDRSGRCKPGVLRQGWKPARAETAPLAPFTTARPARGTPGKSTVRRTTKQTVIRTGGKRE